MGFIHTIPYSNDFICTFATTRNNFYNEMEITLEGFNITWNGFGMMCADLRSIFLDISWHGLDLWWLGNNFRMAFYWIGSRNDKHGMEWLGKYVMTRDDFRIEWDLDYPNKHKVSKTPTTNCVISLRLASHWPPCVPPSHDI